MQNMQEQQLERVSFSFPIPEGIAFAEEERRPVPDVFFDTGSSRYGYFDCLSCDNKGFVYRTDADGCVIASECECMVQRRNLFRLRKSGLEHLAERCTFDSFETPEPWQAYAKKRALDYLDSEEGKWLYFTGQSGCGKTHLCTAVCTVFMEQGREVLYVLWRQLVHELMGLQYKPEAYTARMEQLQKADILYIDDFLKNIDRNAAGRELNLAFEVINARYNRGSRTILSSELFDTEITELDQAMGSRITKRAKGHTIQIQRDTGRNYRLREV